MSNVKLKEGLFAEVPAKGLKTSGEGVHEGVGVGDGMINPEDFRGRTSIPGLEVGEPVPFLPEKFTPLIEFVYKGTAIHLNQNGTFSGINGSGEIVRDGGLVPLVEQALAEGYFELDNFDPDTIVAIRAAIEKNNPQQRKKQ